MAVSNSISHEYSSNSWKSSDLKEKASGWKITEIPKYSGKCWNEILKRNILMKQDEVDNSFTYNICKEKKTTTNPVESRKSRLYLLQNAIIRIQCFYHFWQKDDKTYHPVIFKSSRVYEALLKSLWKLIPKRKYVMYRPIMLYPWLTSSSGSS